MAVAQAKTHWQKLFLKKFLSISLEFFICSKCNLHGDVTQKFVSVASNFVLAKSK